MADFGEELALSLDFSFDLSLLSFDLSLRPLLKDFEEPIFLLGDLVGVLGDFSLDLSLDLSLRPPLKDFLLGAGEFTHSTCSKADIVSIDERFLLGVLLRDFEADELDLCLRTQ